MPRDRSFSVTQHRTVNPLGAAVPTRTWRNLVPALDYQSLINIQAENKADYAAAELETKEKGALGSRFGGEGEVPGVTRDFSGWRGGL